MFTLTQLFNGDIVAGGDIHSTASGGDYNLLRWNGTAWAGFGFFGGRPLASLVLPAGATGELLVGHSAGQSGILKWDGTTWTALGGGVNAYVAALTELPGGQVLAGGQFGVTAAGLPDRRLAMPVRWSEDGAGRDPRSELDSAGARSNGAVERGAGDGGGAGAARAG